MSQALRRWNRARSNDRRAWTLEGRAWGITRHSAHGQVSPATADETMGFIAMAHELLRHALQEGDSWAVDLGLRAYDRAIEKVMK
jgi:hypothetical protein